MFIDPEPKRHTHSQMARTPSQSSMASEYHRSSRSNVKRRPLEERSQSENNRQQQPSRSAPKSTIRLVKYSPPSPALRPPGSSDASSLSDGETRAYNTYRSYGRASTRLGSSSSSGGYGPSAAESGLHDTWASSSDRVVSDATLATNETKEAHKLDFPPSITLLPSKSSNYDIPVEHNRHRWSGSSGRQSHSSTFRDPSTLGDWTAHRLSQSTTLRGTPTPTEQELREQLDKEKASAKQGTTHVLETLEEASPERPSAATVRAVLPSDLSSSSDLNWESTGLGSSSRPQSSDSTSPDPREPQSPGIPRKSSRRRAASAGSLPGPSTIPGPSSTLSVLRSQASQDSIAQSPLRPSSPIIVLYDSDSSQPQPPNRSIRYTPSVESIQSRLQYPTVIQPQAAHSLAPSSSWASLAPSSDEDTLPPLHIPKKRVRQKPVPLNRVPHSSSASSSGMDHDEPDTSPYPRQQFISHLSTILSEGDGMSTANRHSYFSMGSGVLTGDDASSIPLPGTWPRVRRRSTLDSLADDEQSPRPPGTAQSQDDPGDMTLDLYREESAKPQPLFNSKSGMGEDRRYEGPRPPVPPIPRGRDSDENFDTVSELQTPSLKPKRSGYSLRRRSHSTPGENSRRLSQISSDDSVRNSNGSSIFPAWAKFFYSSRIGLFSPSKVSLQQKTPNAKGHQRSESTYTERSITSRLGTGYGARDNPSPTSSRFLPSIFRPHTQSKESPDTRPSTKKLEKTPNVSNEQPQEPERDSMCITVAPYPNRGVNDGPDSNDTAEELLPSGHPRWGKLKDSPKTRRPLPRRYLTQREWNEMTFPRPMSTDRLSDFHNPCLMPSKRASQSRLSLWRPPSFVESLDSLVHSRANRQILLFSLGFVCPLLWMFAAVLPLPPRPISAADLEKNIDGAQKDDIQAAMMKHEAGDAEKRWREERIFIKARWWRGLNRIMSVIGVLVITAVIALAIIATR